MKEVIEQARRLAKKFVDKVESGRAKSVETYKECQELLVEIESLKDISALVITKAELLISELMTERNMYSARGSLDKVKSLDRIINTFRPFITKG